MATRTIDTNILLRLLVDDHTEQADVAARLAAQYTLVVMPTVMLETEWVLRSRFGLSRSVRLVLLRRVVEFDHFLVIEKARVTRALECFAKGMDFADAMHVCLTPEGETFVTFDRDLVRLAKRHMNSAGVELAT